jgi:hypothetical protein
MVAFQPEYILFWISMLLAPANTSQVHVKGPDFAAAWTRQESGWSYSADRSVWSIENNTLTRTVQGKPEKRVMSANLEDDKATKRIKEHDWKASPTLKLGEMASLAKKGETFVVAFGGGAAGEKQYVIRYQGQGATRTGAVKPAK